MKQVVISSVPEKDGIIVLQKNDYTHLVSVLRKKTGTKLKIRTLEGNLFNAEITEINRTCKTLTLKILPEETCFTQKQGNRESASVSSLIPVENFPRIILLQWVLKNSKMDLVVRQAAEIGISHILPVIGEYSVVKKQNASKSSRHDRIIREAIQQSGSPVPTQILNAMPLDDALDKCAELTENMETVMLGLYENNTAKESIYSLLKRTTEAVVLAVGSEGGISGAEIETLKKSGFHIIHFKTNILRAETAALYAAAAVQSALNEVEKWQ